MAEQKKVLFTQFIPAGMEGNVKYKDSIPYLIITKGSGIFLDRCCEKCQQAVDFITFGFAPGGNMLRKKICSKCKTSVKILSHRFT